MKIFEELETNFWPNFFWQSWFTIFVAEVIRSLVTDTWKKIKLRYDHLCGFLEAKMANLSPIDF